jgi:stearoyl-CoA desaturase (Delta-9 desaturase)
MDFLNSAFFAGLVDVLAHGFTQASWWQIVLYTLVTTHITIASVTIYLHRAMSHRALDLHKIPEHFFRFWLWIGTGMKTIDFVSVHRKHHAKCETEQDPHSPQTRGLKALLLTGTELYRAEAANQETLSKYGYGCPQDWVERHVYSPHSILGVALMMIVNIALFGAIGLTVWAIQMAWIPVLATGVINGIGHYWGYRNFESPDAATNVSPWGILIGGEELHNNHHTYATSAKFSVKPYEFDIGWVYISALQKMGLATVKKVAPKLALGDVKPVADNETLEALIAHRYELMAAYARDIRAACKAEIATLKAKQGDVSLLKTAKRWLHRDDEKVPASAQAELKQARLQFPALGKMTEMRDELRQMWSNTTLSREQLSANLAAWCKRAEESGITALQNMSLRLRAAQLRAVPV